MISCIYEIRNIITNDIYIGSTNNFKKRIWTHKRQLIKNKHHSIYLQRSVNKYGLNNFMFNILELAESKDLLKTEQHYIDSKNPSYNCAKSSTAPMKNKKHSDETKRKMSQIHKGNKYNLGKKHSDEYKEIKRQLRLGTKLSVNTKQKMSETAKKINSINRIDHEKAKKKIIDSNGLIHYSLTDCAKFHNIHIATLCDILHGRHSKTRKGVSFKYYENT